MRWFIEVSTVGSGETDTEYCVEAKQWQAALQQARKLRGEGGPLSAFSIELLDSGYRAVDKKQNLKYVVKKAPNDAPLNDGKNGSASTAAEAKANEVEPVKADPAAQESEKSAPEQSAPGHSAPQHAVASSPRASGPPPRPRLVSSRPPPDDGASEAGKSAAKSKSRSGAPTPKGGARISGTPVKKGPQKVAELLAAAAMKAGKGTSNPPAAARVTGSVGASQPSAARALPATASANAAVLAKQPDKDQEPDKVEAPGQEADVASSPLPDFEVIRTREEEPNAETPITYREVALAVNPGASKRATEALLWARFRSIESELTERAKGKFVQLAVFDHVFAKKPIRPPVATLLWKDWRGEPVLAFPGFSGDSIPPEALPAEEPAVGSLRPTSVIPVDETTGSRPPPPRELETSSETPPDGETTSSPQEQESQGAAARADTAAEQASAGAAAAGASADTSAQLEPPGSDIGGAEGGAGVATTGETPVPLQRRKTKSERPARVSEGPPSRQRDPVSEDLIGDLFEKMHELHFMADVVAGADYVLSVVKQTLPGAFALVHVFDINTKNFVVVRQYGANEKTLLFQTPDSDPHLRSVMRSVRTINLEASNIDGAREGGRWKAGGVVPETLLCGPVKQGGRYLGLIEIGNGAGAKPFADVEANALDYICEQFAEFLTNRPIVLDADLILK